VAQLVVFLRGINVGRNRRVPMADLRELLEGKGYSDVRTLLQSGNVVLHSPHAAAKTVEHLEKILKARFGFDIEVMVRTAAQLRKVVEADPLGTAGADPKKHMVHFLSAKPTAAALKAARDGDWGKERFELAGKELYVWMEHGLMESKLNRALSEKQLGVRATVRNWNTVLKVDQLASGA
jgi:uncharacterized protein (DUF1697 family)